MGRAQVGEGRSSRAARPGRAPDVRAGRRAARRAGRPPGGRSSVGATTRPSRDGLRVLGRAQLDALRRRAELARRSATLSARVGSGAVARPIATPAIEPDDERDGGGDGERAPRWPAGLPVEGHAALSARPRTATAVPRARRATARGRGERRPRRAARRTVEDARPADDRDARQQRRDAEVERPAAIASRSCSSSARRARRRSRAWRCSASGDPAEAVDDRDGAGAVLAEHAVEVVARRRPAARPPASPSAPAAARSWAGSSTGSRLGGARLERDRAGRDGAQQPVARLEERLDRAPSAARRPRRRMPARPRARARAPSPAPSRGGRPRRARATARRRWTTGPRGARAHAAAGRGGGRPRARAPCRPRRARRSARRGPKLVRARGVGDRVGDLRRRRASSRARAASSARSSAAARAASAASAASAAWRCEPCGAMRRRRGTRPSALRGAGRGQRVARAVAACDDGVLLGVAGARRDQLELGALELARGRRSRRTGSPATWALRGPPRRSCAAPTRAMRAAGGADDPRVDRPDRTSGRPITRSVRSTVRPPRTTRDVRARAAALEDDAVGERELVQRRRDARGRARSRS